MHRRDSQDSHDGELPEAQNRKFVRRGRRFTPPGEPFQRIRPRNPRLSIFAGASVQIGDVIAELTPRQAVVWLLNLDTMVSLYESTTEHHLSAQEREGLIAALRQIVREKGLR
jgi:hypothetical protein